MLTNTTIEIVNNEFPVLECPESGNNFPVRKEIENRFFE